MIATNRIKVEFRTEKDFEIKENLNIVLIFQPPESKGSKKNLFKFNR